MGCEMSVDDGRTYEKGGKRRRKWRGEGGAFLSLLLLLLFHKSGRDKKGKEGWRRGSPPSSLLQCGQTLAAYSRLTGAVFSPPQRFDLGDLFLDFPATFTTFRRGGAIPVMRKRNGRREEKKGLGKAETTREHKTGREKGCFLPHMGKQQNNRRGVNFSPVRRGESFGEGRVRVRFCS